MNILPTLISQREVLSPIQHSKLPTDPRDRHVIAVETRYPSSANKKAECYRTFTCSYMDAATTRLTDERYMVGARLEGNKHSFNEAGLYTPSLDMAGYIVFARMEGIHSLGKGFITGWGEAGFIHLVGTRLNRYIVWQGWTDT
jgi:hypothetical protein